MNKQADADKRRHVTVRLPRELADRIDEAAQGVPRERWVRMVLTAALSSRNMDFADTFISRKPADAVSRAAEQAERSVPAPESPPAVRRSPTSEKELEGLRNIAGVQRASNFVKPSAAMERQRKLNARNEGKG